VGSFVLAGVDQLNAKKRFKTTLAQPYERSH